MPQLHTMSEASSDEDGARRTIIVVANSRRETERLAAADGWLRGDAGVMYTEPNGACVDGPVRVLRRY